MGALGHEHPNVHLAKVEVREALAHALNKAQVVETLYTPLFGDLLPTAGLGNAFWMSNQPAYVDHQGEAGYGTGDVEAAKALLEGAGYVLGADGIYEHPTDGRLSLRVGTTGGNQLRELQQQLIQAQMLEAGIEIVIENLPGSGVLLHPVRWRSDRVGAHPVRLGGWPVAGERIGFVPHRFGQQPVRLRQPRLRRQGRPSATPSSTRRRRRPARTSWTSS